MRPSQAQFGPVAAAYATSSAHADEQALGRLLEVLKTGGRIALDVATGSGNAAIALATRFEKVLASDITAEMLALARKRAQELGLSWVSVAFADACRLPFATGAFDLVCCRIAAHHFEDVRAFVHEAFRVLAEKGRLLLVDNVGFEDEGADILLDGIERLRDPSHVRYLRPLEWRGILESAGFEITRWEVSKKSLNVPEWLERMRTPAAIRKVILDKIEGEPLLREWLRPEGEGGAFAIHLDELLVVASKSPHPKQRDMTATRAPLPGR